ncbi:MAG: T9SS type A sorting domain-containing protein [Bacteroidales bacterium]|nr:T9SS type A sorting domain-containing protein [Bacteroidales bacterium]
MTTNSVGENKLRFYRIDRQMQKIEPVASVPFSVRPTVMERGQEIVVELDEGSNAREIEVVNALGQTVKRVPVAAGQREVRINSADMGSGMNFISTRTTEGQGTVKIIVR